MPLRMVSGVSRGTGVLDGVVIVKGEGAVLFEASHCNQWGLCDVAYPKLLWAGLVFIMVILTVMQCHLRLTTLLSLFGAILKPTVSQILPTIDSFPSSGLPPTSTVLAVSSGQLFSDYSSFLIFSVFGSVR